MSHKRREWMTAVFTGKKIVLGVTGSIAAFKVAGWTSRLVAEDAAVDVVMTEAATRFVAPLTFGALTGRKVWVDIFDAEQEGFMSHIDLGREADALVIAPATAQTIAKLATGMADNLLTSTVLAADKPVIVCPAMNVRMYHHPATQANIKRLRELGYTIIEPEAGPLACGDYGSGRLVEWESAKEFILRTVSEPDLSGQHVLVTAGPTRESFDPARFISNRSSGKMGFAIARSAFRRGAEVTLVTGPVALKPPAGIKTISVTTAREMYDAVMAESKQATVIVKAAAVSDFRPADAADEKVKKEDVSQTVRLAQNPDILKELGNRRNPSSQLLVGFAAESCNLEREGRRKLREKRLDLIAVNDISTAETGFESHHNQLLLITGQTSKMLIHTSKNETADLLWDFIVEQNMLPIVR